MEGSPKTWPRSAVEGLDASDRTLGEHRTEDRERLVDTVDLAAQAAVDGASHEEEPVRGHLENLRRSLQAEEQRLRVRIADVAPRGVGRRNAPAGLGRRVLDRRPLVALCNDVIGLAESSFYVAERNLLEVVVAESYQLMHEIQD